MSGFTNLGDLIRRDRDLAKIAIVDLGGEHGPRDFTFTQLDTMANGVARALAKRGLQRGDRIALLSANRAEYIAAIFGIMRAGFVAVPVNFKFPKETVAFILADSGTKFMFWERPDQCPYGTAGASLAGILAPGEFTAVTPEPREPAMFLYTSGSTGVP